MVIIRLKTKGLLGPIPSVVNKGQVVVWPRPACSDCLNGAP